MGLVFTIGAICGVIFCMIFAILFKAYNLGLFWNTITGVLVGGAGTVLVWSIAPQYDFAHVLVAVACAVVMSIVGNVLNNRAR